MLCLQDTTNLTNTNTSRHTDHSRTNNPKMTPMQIL